MERMLKKWLSDWHSVEPEFDFRVTSESQVKSSGYRILGKWLCGKSFPRKLLHAILEATQCGDFWSFQKNLESMLYLPELYLAQWRTFYGVGVLLLVYNREGLIQSPHKLCTLLKNGMVNKNHWKCRTKVVARMWNTHNKNSMLLIYIYIYTFIIFEQRNHQVFPVWGVSYQSLRLLHAGNERVWDWKRHNFLRRAPTVS